MKNKTYNCKKIINKYIIDKLDKPLNYSLKNFGFKNLQGDGSGVKICIIDSGVPNNKFIKTKVKNSIDFTNTSIQDFHGHATAVAGLMIAKVPGYMTGLIPNVNIIYAKAIKNSGEGDHGAVQASILYSIIQSVDIIVMSFGCEHSHPSLQDAISKAYNNNICLIAAAGNYRSNTKDADFPARLPQVLSVGLKDSKGKNIQYSSTDYPAIDLSIDNLYTTYLDDKFAKMGGSSIATPIAASAVACVIQNQKNKKYILEVSNIYKQVMHSIT